jgi:hypothetical protein
MAQKKIHIVWQDGKTIDILLEDNPVADYYYGCIKHLQNIDLHFDARKNPLYAQQTNQEDVIKELLSLAPKVGLEVIQDQITDQTYLNQLHAIYFENARQSTFDPVWLQIHDCIHVIEDFIGTGLTRTSIWFDYESKAGPLIKPFDREYLKHAVTDVAAGMCYIREHELGKNPALYRQHGEPADANTICAQSKPWIWLKPVLSIAFRGHNNYNTFDELEFNQWFAPLRDSWCQHWSVPDWNPKEMFSVIPVGVVENLTEFVDCFIKQDYPKRLVL